jgi:hypothetical protein
MSDVPEELIELAGEICSQIAEFGAPAQETVARALMAERERAAHLVERDASGDLGINGTRVAQEMRIHLARIAAAIRGTA